MTPEQLLQEIVADFAILYSAYAKADLLNDEAPVSPAWKLLGGRDNIDRFRRDFLLADALIRNRVARCLFQENTPRHLAVFGGNNVGKSTVVNILLRESAAGASPEGGHTRCPQAFTESASLFGSNPFAFNRFEAVKNEAFVQNRPGCYLISASAGKTVPTDVAFWDTPDCDAVGSANYAALVVETIAAADAVIYVTSVEKYAVEHLVEWLFQLNDSGTPLIECLNKTPKRDREAVIKRQQEFVFPTVAKRLGLVAPSMPIIALRNMTEGEESDLWGPEHPEAAELREKSLIVLSQTDREASARKAVDFVRRHLDHLIQPVRLEVESLDNWNSAVDSAILDFCLSYEKDYLTSTRVIEPFTRLNVEILKLIDPNIPGLKQAMHTVRWATRFPAKMVLWIGRRVFSFISANDAESKDEKEPTELRVYSAAHIRLLNTLGKRIDTERNAERHHPFWDSLAVEFEELLESLTKRFADEAKSHMERSDAEIVLGAQDILEQLRKNPATLALLRGLRVAADVGGFVGGLFITFLLPGGGMVSDILEELFIAPSIMVATEAASTALAANYVDRRREALVTALSANARDLAEKVYRADLLSIETRTKVRSDILGVDKEILTRLPERLIQMQSYFG